MNLSPLVDFLIKNQGLELTVEGERVEQPTSVTFDEAKEAYNRVANGFDANRPYSRRLFQSVRLLTINLSIEEDYAFLADRAWGGMAEPLPDADGRCAAGSILSRKFESGYDLLREYFDSPMLESGSGQYMFSTYDARGQRVDLCIPRVYGEPDRFNLSMYVDSMRDYYYLGTVDEDGFTSIRLPGLRWLDGDGVLGPVVPTTMIFPPGIRMINKQLSRRNDDDALYTFRHIRSFRRCPPIREDRRATSNVKIPVLGPAQDFEGYTE